jgi:hypothetical protein
MLLELARPLTLLASMISLLAVFHTAFLGSETDMRQRLYDTLGMLLIAAGISLVSGLTFLNGRLQESRYRSAARGDLSLRITETFPMQLFCWTTGIMAILFLLAWYLETHCIFYRDIHH